jgi:hypothetical protein
MGSDTEYAKVMGKQRKFIKTFGILALTSIFLLTLINCVPPSTLKKTSESGAKEPTVLKGSDEQSQITMPKGWNEIESLHEKASIQIGDVANEVYVLVFSQSKEDFDQMNIDKYSELTRVSMLEAIKSPQLSSPSRLTINGNPALQYEIRGVVNNFKLVYLQIIIEGERNFHEIIAWTLASQFEKNRSQLEGAISTFKETELADQSK